MIVVSGTSFDISGIINDYPENGIERLLLDKMHRSNDTYLYDNLSQLKFELDYRREIVNTAVNLNNSEFGFSNFKNSKCNLKYWNRTDNGGFSKITGVKSSDAINDIFINGNEYTTECATAIMIVYYKGLLNIYGDDLFNKLFPKIYLMDWDVTEPLLKEVANPQIPADILLGDRVYFSNPDFDPKAPEWVGENAIVLPDSMYYGHGIGIETSVVIIQDLNSRRKEGATQSAYFEDLAGRPDFNKLASVYHNRITQSAPLVWRPFPAPISAT